MSGSGWSMASMTVSQILAGAAFQVCCPGLIPQRAQKMQRPQMNVPVGEGLQGQRREASFSQFEASNQERGAFLLPPSLLLPRCLNPPLEVTSRGT